MAKVTLMPKGNYGATASDATFARSEGSSIPVSSRLETYSATGPQAHDVHQTFGAGGQFINIVSQTYGTGDQLVNHMQQDSNTDAQFTNLMLQTHGIGDQFAATSGFAAVQNSVNVNPLVPDFQRAVAFSAISPYGEVYEQAQLDYWTAHIERHERIAYLLHHLPPAQYVPESQDFLDESERSLEQLLDDGEPASAGYGHDDWPEQEGEEVVAAEETAVETAADKKSKKGSRHHGHRGRK